MTSFFNSQSVFGSEKRRAESIRRVMVKDNVNSRSIGLENLALMTNKPQSVVMTHGPHGTRPRVGPITILRRPM